MKKTIIIFLSAIILYSCGEIEKKRIKANNEYPTIDTIDAFDGTSSRKIHLYVIDSCEYIGYIDAYRSDFLAHKGNCKFCAIRNKTIKKTQ